MTDVKPQGAAPTAQSEPHLEQARQQLAELEGELKTEVDPKAKALGLRVHTIFSSVVKHLEDFGKSVEAKIKANEAADTKGEAHPTVVLQPAASAQSYASNRGGPVPAATGPNVLPSPPAQPSKPSIPSTPAPAKAEPAPAPAKPPEPGPSK